jgi:hypothetical protein
MGIMSNKVTRRAALGSIIASLVGAAFVVRGLKGRHEVNMPNGAPVETVGGKFVMKYEGRDVTLDLPRMELRTQEDKDRLKAIIAEQLKKNPTVQEVRRLEFKAWKEENKRVQLAGIDEFEKERLGEIAASKMSEEEKRVAAKELKERVLALRAQCVKLIDESKLSLPSGYNF